MLPINYDYSDLVEQLCYAGRQFSKCRTKEERFLVYETYLGLIDSYFSVTEKEFCNKKLYRSFTKEGENFFLEVCASNFNTFIENKEFHTNLMLSCYEQLDSFFQEFCESSYCGCLEKKKIFPINEETDEDSYLLMNFFNEKVPKLCSLYHGIISSGNLYSLGEDDWLREGLSIFNLVQKKANVFVSSFNPSFKELSIVPHELGHVEEFNYFLEHYSIMDTLRYFSSGFLSEVVSTYYEQLFLEFYMNHGNIELIDLGILSPSFLSEEDRIIGVDISPVYAYGFLLANYFLEYPKSYALFNEKKNQSFSPEFLESVGITTESLSKTLIKRSEHLFGKYLD